MPVKIVRSSSIEKMELDAFIESGGSGFDLAVFNNSIMTRSAFDIAEQDFDDHFKIDGVRDIQSEWHSFLFSELANLVSVIPAAKRLVIVHFGLDGDNLRYGFSFREGKKAGATERYDYTPSPDPSHILLRTDFLPISAADWSPLRQAYIDRIQVSRNGGAFEALTPVDGLRVVIPWDGEIEEMFRLTTEGINDDFRLVIDSVSLKHGTQTENGQTTIAGFRHGVAFYVERKNPFSWLRMLDDANITIYRNKAADYGNLCPVRCAYYER